MEKPNWRHSYQLTIEAEIRDLRRHLDLGEDRSFELDGDTLHLSELEPDDVRRLAELAAEKVVNEAIHRWNETH